MARFFIFFVLIMHLNPLNAQENCDSLLAVWHDSSKPDSSRFKSIKKCISDCYLYPNPDTAKILGLEFLELAVKRKNSEARISALNYLGIANYHLSEYASAKKYWEEGLEEEDLDSAYRMAFLVNLGNVASNLNDVPEGIKLYTQALIICDLLEDSARRPILIMNIGTLYSRIGDTETAHEKFEESYIGFNEIVENKNIEAIITVLSNLIDTEIKLHDVNKALEYSNEMLAMAKESNNHYNILLALNGRSKVLMEMEKWELALEALDSCLYYSNQMKEVRLKRITYNNMSATYLALGQNKKALEAAHNGYNLALNNDNIEWRMSSSFTLYKAYKANKKMNKALTLHEEYVLLKDSLSKEENEEEMIHQEYRYEYEKNAIRDSIEAEKAMKIQQLELSAEKARNEQFEIEKEKQRQQIYFLILGLILAVIFVGFIYNRLKLTKRQKKVISKQKDIVEFHRSRIIESINYSKKIQNALLPNISGFSEDFQDGFMIFEPKDIVSGDLFYLKNQGHRKVIGCLDCTGHGVPGGFLSTLSGLITDRVIDDNWDLPHQILKNLSDEIIRVLKQEREDAIQDGMDAAFCVLNEDHSELLFAGARLDVLIYRNEEFTRYEGDLLPVGGHYTKKGIPIKREFTTQSVKLEQGDWIILQTDGLFEQPGGKEHFPMKDAALFDLLERVIESEDRQKTFQSDLKTWIGTHERTDDICVFGFKV